MTVLTMEVNGCSSITTDSSQTLSGVVVDTDLGNASEAVAENDKVDPPGEKSLSITNGTEDDEHTSKVIENGEFALPSDKGAKDKSSIKEESPEGTEGTEGTESVIDEEDVAALMNIDLVNIKIDVRNIDSIDDTEKETDDSEMDQDSALDVESVLNVVIADVVTEGINEKVPDEEVAGEADSILEAVTENQEDAVSATTVELVPEETTTEEALLNGSLDEGESDIPADKAAEDKLLGNDSDPDIDEMEHEDVEGGLEIEGDGLSETVKKEPEEVTAPVLTESPFEDTQQTEGQISPLPMDVDVASGPCPIQVGSAVSECNGTVKKEISETLGKRRQDETAGPIEEGNKRLRLETDEASEESSTKTISNGPVEPCKKVLEDARRALVGSDSENEDDPDPCTGFGSAPESDGDDNAAEKNSSAKTSTVEPAEPSTSKSKEGPSLEESIRNAALPVIAEFRRGTLDNITASDFEELIIQKLCEAITERSDVGELRRRAQHLQVEIEKYRDRWQVLSKQMRDLETVMKRYLADVQKGNTSTTPVRITRSVGLQVALMVGNKRPVVGSNLQKSPVKPLRAPAIKTRPMSPKRNLPGKTGNVATKSTTQSSRVATKSTTQVPKPPPLVLGAPRGAGSGVIDLTDEEERPGGSTKRTQSTEADTSAQPGGSVALLLPSQQGAQQRVLIARPPTPQQVPAPPPLLYGGHQTSQPARSPANAKFRVLQHPAPLPATPPNTMRYNASWKLRPPRPSLKISEVSSGIVLSWDMTLSPEYETIASYQLMAYQEGATPPNPSLWKKVGEVKALPLPMACTLTHFVAGHRYHFSVRAVDVHLRVGPYSLPSTIRHERT